MADQAFLFGERLFIDSTFRYNQETNSFDRQFGSEKVGRTYMQHRDNFYPFGESMNMQRRQYLKTLDSVLRVLPFDPSEQPSQYPLIGQP